MEEPSRKRSKTMDPQGFEETKFNNTPLPFTCICYKGNFKVTDGEGAFTIPDEANPDKTMIFRCEEDEGRNVVYTYIRSVHNSDLDGLENIDELNVLRNTTLE